MDEDFVLATVSLALNYRQVMSSEHISKETKETIRTELKRINARLTKARHKIQRKEEKDGQAVQVGQGQAEMGLQGHRDKKQNG